MSASDASYVADKRKVGLLQKLQHLRGGIGHVQYKELTQLPLFHLGGRNTNNELDQARLGVVEEEIGLIADLFRRGPDGTMPGEPSLYAENVDNVLNRLHRRLQLLEDAGNLWQHQKAEVHPETEHEPEQQQRTPGHAPGRPSTVAAAPSPTVHPQPLPEHQRQQQYAEQQQQREHGRLGHRQRGEHKSHEERQVRVEGDEVGTESVPPESEETSLKQSSRTDGDVQTKDDHPDLSGSVWDPTDEIDRRVGQGNFGDNGVRSNGGYRSREDESGNGNDRDDGNADNVVQRNGREGGEDERAVNAIIDNNKGNGQVFNMRRWRVPPKSISIPTYCDGRPNGTYEYVSSTAENLRAATQEAFPQFGTPECNQHGLSKRDYDEIKRLSARLKVVARVRLNDHSGGRFVEYFIRATDEEIKAALKEDGVAAAITVGVYTRAASIMRSRQAAAKAAKESVTAAIAVGDAAATAGADKRCAEGVGRGAFEGVSSTGTDTGGAGGIVPWQKRTRTG